MTSNHKKKLVLESLEGRRVLSADGALPLADSLDDSRAETTEAIVGDIDGNGHCGFEDFLIMAQNMGRHGADSGMGDLDGDGAVAFSDFLMLAQNFNRGKAADAPRGKPDDVPRGPKTDDVANPTEADEEPDTTVGPQNNVGRPLDLPRGPKSDQPTGRPTDVPRGPKDDGGDDGVIDETDGNADGETGGPDENNGRPSDVPRGPNGDQPIGRPTDVPRGPKEDGSGDDDHGDADEADGDTGEESGEADENNGRPTDAPRGPKIEQPTGRPTDVPRDPKSATAVEARSDANVELAFDSPNRIDTISDKVNSSVIYAVDSVFAKIDDLD